MMFRLMDRVSDGIAPLLKYFQDHIIHAGLADMMVAAKLITQVGHVDRFNANVVMNLEMRDRSTA